MSKGIELTGQIGRWEMAGIAILLGVTMSVSAGAQQTTPRSAGPRTSPCPVPQASGATTGVTTATANGETGTPSTTGTTGTTSTTGTTGTTTANNGTNGTPTDAATTAGVAASPTPNNTSTNASQRLTGLNATNGANGVGADTTTTGKRVPPVAEKIPSDTVRTGETVCAPTTTKNPG